MKKQFSAAELDDAQQQIWLHLKRAKTIQPLLESVDLCSKLGRYAKALLETNQFLNLTAITDPEAVAYLHFIDSLTLLPYFSQLFPVEKEMNGRWIDVGTGAGFPSLPVQICRPWGELTLLDSLQKRVQFLEDIKALCQVKSAVCLHGRAEDIARLEAYRETYDLATARAVANLSTLSELCLPFVRVGGYFLALKGPQDETVSARSAIQRLGGKIVAVDRFVLPYENAERSIVIIEKRKNTPSTFPRKAGLPAKKPL